MKLLLKIKALSRKPFNKMSIEKEMKEELQILKESFVEKYLTDHFETEEMILAEGEQKNHVVYDYPENAYQEAESEFNDFVKAVLGEI